VLPYGVVLSVAALALAFWYVALPAASKRSKVLCAAAAGASVFGVPGLQGWVFLPFLLQAAVCLYVLGYLTFFPETPLSTDAGIVHLSPGQREQLLRGVAPVTAVDALTQERYALLSSEQFEAVRSALEQRVRARAPDPAP
jgi:hypothetical protein